MSGSGDASMGARRRAPAPSSGNQVFDIRNYKCVPLDLLKNIGTNSAGTDIIEVTSTEQTLKDFKQAQSDTISAEGPSSGFSGDDLENFIVFFGVGFFILILLVILYWGFLNLRANGLGAFRLPDQLRSMPVLAFFSLIFGVVGFLIGSLTKS